MSFPSAEKLANLASLPDRLGVGPPRGNAIEDALAAIRRHDAADYLPCQGSSVEGANAIAEAREILEAAVTLFTVGLKPPPLGGICAHCQRPMPATAFQLWLDQNGETLTTIRPKLRELTGLSCTKNWIFRVAHHWPGYRSHTRDGKKKNAAYLIEALMELTGLPRDAFQTPTPGNGGYYFEPGCDAGLRR